MPLYRLLSVRYLLRRWDRAALIVASIALGVATLVSARILNACFGAAAAQTTTPVRVGDLCVGNGEAGVTSDVAADLRAADLPAVESVQPLVYERVRLPDLPGPGGEGRPAVLVGVELAPSTFAPGNPLGVTVTWTGEGPRLQLLLILKAVEEHRWADAADLWRRVPDRLVVVGRQVYDDHRAKNGPAAPLVVRFGSRDVPCLPVGVLDVDPRSPMAALGRNVVGMELGQAARFVRPGPADAAAAAGGGPFAAGPVWDDVYPSKVHRVDVVLKPGADVAAARADVRGVVGDRASVNTPDAQGRATDEIVSGVQLAFGLCSAASMVVGLFLVYNALAVTVAERRHDIGVLRSLGATRWQIVALFAAMAVLLGLVGAAAGIPLGVGMARAVLYEFREELGSMFLTAEFDPGWPTGATVGLAVLAGVLTAVLAALLPAVQAATQDPADAVRRSPRPAGGGWRVAHRLTCLLLIGGGLAAIAARHHLPPRVGSFGGLITALVGLLLSAPVVVGVLIRLVQPVLRRVLPIEARLASDNLTRSPGRTGVVIGALGAGVAVMIQTAGVGQSNEEPVVRWLDEVIQADRFVSAGNLTEASSSQAPMDETVVRDAGRLPGVDEVAGIRYARPEYNGTVVFLVAIDARAYADQAVRRGRAAPDGLSRLSELAGRRAVLVSDNFAVKHGVAAGDTLTLPGPAGPVRLEVLGTVRDYSWSRGTVFMDRAVYAGLFQDRLVDVLDVYLADPAAGSEGDRAVARFAADRGLVVQDRETVRGFLGDLIDRVYTVAYLQQIIVGVVAALGVVTALLISVLQRKRELGLLLAVGATPGQVLRSVVWEAVLMGAFGTVLGVLIGVPMEWYVLRVVMLEESGFVFDVVLPWRQGLGIAAGAVAVAGLAGLGPAVHAVRTRIPDAVGHE